MSIGNLELHNFEVHDVEAWREHYMHTTRLWHDRLTANREAAEREIGPRENQVVDRLSRRGFDRLHARHVGIFQTLASRRVRGPSITAADPG